LRAEFPDVKGFSVTNLYYCKYFYQLYSQNTQIHQQVINKILPQLEENLQISDNEGNTILPQVGEELPIPLIFLIPWGHQKYIIDKCKSVNEALFFPSLYQTLSFHSNFLPYREQRLWL
ncbi:hypothetical protein EZS27_044483, partial [termite gut metagenome]